MGCCNSATKIPAEMLDQQMSSNIKTASTKRLDYYISVKTKQLSERFNIDSLTIVGEEGVELNLMSLCMLHGRLDLIIWLHESQNASFAGMESCLSKFGYSALRIICENNYLEIFEYYSEVYMRLKSSMELDYTRTIAEIPNLDSDPKILNFLKTHQNAKFTPLHFACIYGNISIIKAIFSFSSTLQSIPIELDIHYIESGYGYNCALLACEQGNYNMIKFLHNCCKSNFKHATLSKQSALQLLFSGASLQNSPDLYNCLTYLIEKIKVDIAYNYTELLPLCELYKASDYFIQKLLAAGVKIDKSELESKRKGNILRFGSFTEPQNKSDSID